MHSPGTEDRTALLLTGICIAGLVVLGFLLWMAQPDVAPPEGATDDSSPSGGPTSGTPNEDHPSRNAGSRAAEDERDRQVGDRPPSETAGQPSTNDDRRRNTDEEGTTDDESRPVDVGTNARQPPDATSGTDYRDPVNQRVLGPRSWMAQPDDATAARLRKAFERDVDDPTDFAVADRDRSRAIQLLHDTAESCARQHLSPDIRGHLIIRAQLVVDDGDGYLEKVRFDDVLELESPAFQNCIENQATDIRFDGDRAGQLTIATGFRFPSTR